MWVIVVGRSRMRKGTGLRNEKDIDMPSLPSRGGLVYVYIHVMYFGVRHDVIWDMGYVIWDVLGEVP